MRFQEGTQNSSEMNFPYRQEAHDPGSSRIQAGKRCRARQSTRNRTRDRKSAVPARGPRGRPSPDSNSAPHPIQVPVAPTLNPTKRDPLPPVLHAAAILRDKSRGGEERGRLLLSSLRVRAAPGEARPSLRTPWAGGEGDTSLIHWAEGHGLFPPLLQLLSWHLPSAQTQPPAPSSQAFRLDPRFTRQGTLRQSRNPVKGKCHKTSACRQNF